MQQPDFSEFVIHFTGNDDPYGVSHGHCDSLRIVGVPARDRLIRILGEGVVRPSYMPWTDQRAVCLTECTWPSLLQHCARYSSYGLGFRKATIFAAGGGPAVYIHQDHYDAQCDHGGFACSLYAMLTPFRPSYAPHQAGGVDRDPCDFTHEREWRLPGDLTFTNDQIEFVVVGSHEDIATMPREVIEQIPADRWVIVSSYQKIETLWPQHNV